MCETTGVVFRKAVESIGSANPRMGKKQLREEAEKALKKAYKGRGKDVIEKALSISRSYDIVK